MSLMEHLYELRRRLFVAVLGIFLGSVIGFVWYANGIPAIGIPSLGDILLAPYCAVPSPPRQTFDDPNSCTLLATGPFSILQIRLKAALLAGAVLSAPLWLYELWAYITPALYAKERRFAITFVATGSLLFVGGAVLAYVVVSEGLTILLGFGADTATAALSPDSYFSFLIAMLLIFGVSFELPLLLIMLNMAGVVKAKQLSHWRRYAMFGLVVFAGIVVPGNDPITMLALAVALCILYEIAAQVARIHDRRLARRQAASGLDDDTASPLPAATPDVGDAQPVGAATPIHTPEAAPGPSAPPPPAPGQRPRRFDDLGDAT
jgi:sec-independent protein translocase protein TatC